MKNQIISNANNLVFKDISVSSLKNSFHTHSEGSVSFTNMRFKDVECLGSDDLIGFCLYEFIFAGGKSLKATFQDFFVADVKTDIPLIFASDSLLSFENIEMRNVQSNINNSILLFKDTILDLEKAQFINIIGNVISVYSCELKVLQGVFTNENSKDLQTQFIRSYYSQNTITSTTFQTNSNNYQGLGGALMLIDPKLLTLEDVVFENNTALRGGAIYVESSELFGTIKGCLFLNNIAFRIENSSTFGLGGAIFFEKVGNTNSDFSENSTLRKLVIESCTFDRNLADFGGAVYTRNMTFAIHNSTFTGNKALSGGVLATEMYTSTNMSLNNSQAITVNKSHFENNSAQYHGPSIIELRETTLKTKNSNFAENQAQQFQQGVPAKLRLRVFSSVNINTQRNFFDQEVINATRLNVLYDSFEDKHMLIIENVTSGSWLNEVLEFSIYDSGNNLLKEINSNETEYFVFLLFMHKLIN